MFRGEQSVTLKCGHRRAAGARHPVDRRAHGQPRAEGEEMRATKLQEVEVMAEKLLATAQKLPAGPDRSNMLKEIGRFRSQIISLQGVGLRRARQEGNRAKAE